MTDAEKLMGREIEKLVIVCLGLKDEIGSC